MRKRVCRAGSGTGHRASRTQLAPACSSAEVIVFSACEELKVGEVTPELEEDAPPLEDRGERAQLKGENTS